MEYFKKNKKPPKVKLDNINNLRKLTAGFVLILLFVSS
jgi:hypothetical protein